MTSNDNAPATPDVSDAIIRLYDEYTHTPLGRRRFLDRLALLTGSMSAALALLPVLQPGYARAQLVPADEPRLDITTESVPTADGPLTLYAARPADAAAAVPAVVVIHENRGLNPHIEDVARRVALAGYLALAPDFLSAGGPGTPDDPDQAREMIGALDPRPRWPTRSPRSTTPVAAGATSADAPVSSASAGAAAWSTASPSPIRRSMPLWPSTAPSRRPKTCRQSRRRCCCTMRGWTNASMRGSPTSPPRSTPPARTTRCICMTA